MHGISPRNYSLTPLQQKTSAEISQTIPDFPITLTDLISEMAIPGFQLATEAVELDKYGAAIENERNKEILACIESALTTPSSECAPSIKTKAFSQATTVVDGRVNLQPYMVKLIQKISDQRMRLNLDGVTIKGLRFDHQRESDFTGLSARGATFDQINLAHLRFEGADFTGAKFINTSLQRACLDKATITDAIFSKAWFHCTSACELTGNQSGIVKASHGQSRQHPCDYEVTIFSTELSSDFMDATPDQELFTLPARKQISKSTGKS